MKEKLTSCYERLWDKLLGAFRFPIGMCRALEAEIWGIYQDLKAMWEMGQYRVILEYDNATTMKCINNNKSISGLSINLVEKCKSLVKQKCEVILLHILREHNRLANTLANTDYFDQLEEIKHYHHPLWGFKDWLLREDDQGILGASVTMRTT